MFRSVQDSIRLPHSSTYRCSGPLLRRKPRTRFGFPRRPSGLLLCPFDVAFVPAFARRWNLVNTANFLSHTSVLYLAQASRSRQRGLPPRNAVDPPPLLFAIADRGLYKAPCNARGKWNHHGGFPDYEE